MKTIKTPSQTKHFNDWDFGDADATIDNTIRSIEKVVERAETGLYDIIKEAEQRGALSATRFYSCEFMPFFKGPGEIEISAQEGSEDEICLSFNLHKDIFHLDNTKKITGSKSWPEYFRNLADVLEKQWRDE